MNAKVARLRSLEHIRKLQEDMERAALARAVDAVADVEAALRHDADSVAEANKRSRAALGAGDRSEWLFADAEGEVARASICKLGPLLHQREAAIGPAMETYLAGRTLHEQAKALLATAQSEADDAKFRKAQAEMDQWVVSRWARRAKKMVKDS